MTKHRATLRYATLRYATQSNNLAFHSIQPTVVFSFPLEDSVLIEYLCTYCTYGSEAKLSYRPIVDATAYYLYSTFTYILQSHGRAIQTGRVQCE
jgi:hypothetical protein